MKLKIVEELTVSLPTPDDFTIPRNLQSFTKAVNVDVQKFDQLWAKDEDYYIPPNSKVNTISDRYERFIEWMNERDPNEKIEMPYAIVTNRGTVDFSNGRHRFSVLRDYGLKVIPIAMDKSENEKWIKNAERFGVVV